MSAPFQRSIVHLDADAFFASVEQSADPRLRGKPIAVGGEKRGIIASASYEARKLGIYTPMPTALARRLCPRLILLPGDFDKYELFSRLMFSYAYDFTPDVEIGSIDEGYFDLTGARKPALGIAETIRHAIRQSLRLPVSEGIASNKLISQIASKLKKPAAFEFVPLGHEAEFLSLLPNKWLPGVGPKTAGQLTAAGLALIGQIACTPADLLNLLVGNMAPQLKNFALGIDERPVVPVRGPAKSYGEQETFAADTTDEEFLEATLRRMADKLMAKVRAEGKSIRTLAVKVRYNDMDEEQASESLEEPTDLETEIYSVTSRLLRKAWKRRVSLRLVSLKLSNIYDGRFRSMLALDIPARQHDAQQRLADVVDQLQQKFGRGVVLRGHDFILRAKNGRGEEPNAPTSRGRALSPKAPEQRLKIEKTGRLTTDNGALGERALPSRGLGNTPSARVPQPPAAKAQPIITASPGAELRFRMELKAPINRAPAKRKTAYIPLNVHSCYSFLDSTLSISALIDLAKRHELPAIALTDKNNLHGAVEFVQAAAAAGIKPILGAELTWNGHRLCLYVQNQTGYQNLCRILSVEAGFQPASEGGIPAPRPCGTASRAVGTDDRSHKPSDVVAVRKDLRTSDFFRPSDFGFRISNFELPTHGLLAVSPSPALAPFFPGCFYLEVNSLDAFEKRPAPLPCVASFPVHYALPSDRWKYNIVQSIRTLTLLRQQHPEKRLDGEFHFRPAGEMQRLFAAHPELLARSLEIAERCSFAFSFGKPQFPAYTPPDGSTPAAFLRRLVMDGLKRRYPNEHARIKPQLEEELAIITEVGYEEYFLVMWDILQECGRRGIEWITRGSAADSLACYCLGISDVCPIRFDLYFRRFLNKDRMALNKLPDIDVDFPHDRKDDVIDLIFQRFGPAQTAVVGGFSTFQSRSAFAEVAKVLGVSEYQVRRITERLPHFSRAAELAEAIAGSQECRDLPVDQEPYSTALQMAHILDGFPRYPKMHPCGLVLSRQPMNEITPCFTSAKGYPTTHFDMDSVEAVGLVKMDILAQGGLAVMRDVKRMLELRTPSPELQNREGASCYSCHPEGMESTQPRVARSARPVPTELPWVHEPVAFYPEGVAAMPQDYADGTCKMRPNREADETSSPPIVKNSTTAPPFDLRTSDFGFRTSFDLRTSDFGLPSPAGPFNDPRVWSLIAGGNARAVHHIESPAMLSLCKMCNVRDIDTLIAIVSVIRPGAANESKKMEFARRYQGLSPVRYPHPSLEKCLRSTYGLVVYEEHILQICEAFAGLPPGRADVLRRALGKNKTDIIAQIQTEFADCARRRGRAEKEIAEVWDLVAGFRGYAFCKAHSTAYGVEAYQSAWLKCYYPAEFMAAVLTNGKGFYHPLVYVLECHRLGIPLLPPSVNDPGPGFTVTSDECPAGARPSPGAATSESPLSSQCAPSDKNQSQEKPLSPTTHHARTPKAFGARITHHASPKIRVPILQLKGLTNRAKETILRERARSPFTSLTDFFLRLQPLPEEMEALIQVGAFDSFGKSRTAQYWEFKGNAACKTQIQNQNSKIENHQPWLLPPADALQRLPSVPLAEPDHLARLRAEEELLGYPVSGHPLELFPDIAWDTYCPVNRLGDHIGEQVVTCGLVIEQRLFHQVTGEPMKFLTLADWTGVVETELFARTYQSYGMNTVRYPVLEVTATVEPFENNHGYTLRVLRAGKPRTRQPVTDVSKSG